MLLVPVVQFQSACWSFRWLKHRREMHLKSWQTVRGSLGMENTKWNASSRISLLDNIFMINLLSIIMRILKLESFIHKDYIVLTNDINNSILEF